MELHQDEIAMEVIDTLLQEDDDVFDVWYLRGWFLILFSFRNDGKRGRDQGREGRKS